MSSGKRRKLALFMALTMAAMNVQSAGYMAFAGEYADEVLEETVEDEILDVAAEDDLETAVVTAQAEEEVSAVDLGDLTLIDEIESVTEAADDLELADGLLMLADDSVEADVQVEDTAETVTSETEEIADEIEAPVEIDIEEEPVAIDDAEYAEEDTAVEAYEQVFDIFEAETVDEDELDDEVLDEIEISDDVIDVEEEQEAAGVTLADDVTYTIGVDETITVYIGEGNTYVYFTPEESGEYVLYSSASDDTYATLYIYDAEKDTYEYVKSDDDSGYSVNFALTYMLEANINYAYRVSYLNSSRTGSYNISLKTPTVTTKSIALNEPETVNFNSAYDYTYLTFTADESAEYTIYSSCENYDYNPVATIPA